VKLFLTNGKKYHFNARDNKKNTPLLCGFITGNYNCLSLLIRLQVIDLYHSNENRQNIFHIAGKTKQNKKKESTIPEIVY
jgi:ankyrin repeat protein